MKPTVIQAVCPGAPIVELFRRPRTARAQRLLSVLLLVDEGHGIVASQHELARLLKSDERLLKPAIQELVAEGLLCVEGREPSVYRLTATGGDHGRQAG